LALLPFQVTKEFPVAFQGEYEVQIIEDGSRFGWEIRRRKDLVVVERSAQWFETRGQALAGSALAQIWQTDSDESGKRPQS
jgi:hypothetical protein